MRNNRLIKIERVGFVIAMSVGLISIFFNVISLIIKITNL